MGYQLPRKSGAKKGVRKNATAYFFSFGSHNKLGGKNSEPTEKINK